MIPVRADRGSKKFGVFHRLEDGLETSKTYFVPNNFFFHVGPQFTKKIIPKKANPLKNFGGPNREKVNVMGTTVELLFGTKYKNIQL